MIEVVFYPPARPIGFTVDGHSGYAEAGSDIVCAAVSAMSQLVINTITDVYREQAHVEVTDDGAPHIRFELQTPSHASLGLIKGFRLQMEDFQSQYPEHLRISRKDR